MKDEILRLEQVTTLQNGAALLDHFNLHIFQGEIMGLVCLNKIGEESLIRLICRNTPIHYGRVYFNETLVNNYRHSTMTYNKAAVIEQRSRLVDDLTVSDNVFVLRPGMKKYWLSRRTLNGQLRRVAAEIGVRLEGSELAANLTPCEKCMAELLRAVITGARLIVVRDISNSVSAADLVQVHALLRRLCGRGVSFLYICSHHEEAFKICDRVALMRDGTILKVFDRGEYSSRNVLPFYIGEYANILTQLTEPGRAGTEILTFRDVCTDNMDRLSFRVLEGECTVLLDMSNTVLRDIAALMTGRLRPKSGEIRFCGRPFSLRSAQRAVANGVVCIAQNPARRMVFKDMSYLDNLCFLIGEKRNRMPLSRQVKKYVLKTFLPVVGNCIYEQNVARLSPRQLCDLVYYRVELGRPKLVLCVQPFDGFDMYLRMHLISLIEDMKKKGITVVLLMVNFADSLVPADRLILLKNGHFSAEYPKEKFYLFRSEGITSAGEKHTD